jgi:O-antigen/teichoic acid export membrane protein
MEKNQYEEAKRAFIISLIVLIAIVLLLLIPIHITVEEETDDSATLRGTHVSFFLIGLVPPMISLLGYFLLLSKEREMSVANAVGILSTSLTIIFWIIFLLGFYLIIPFGPASGIIIVFGIISFSIWFGILFDRNRYLSDKIKEFKRERIKSINEANV